ncbi:MAG: MFS transporter [Candidatus Bathyarchaeota archaeon]|nr:MFS transporter [Candidatus Bathyarchaeota archaeon]
MDTKTFVGLSSFQFMAMARRGLFYTFLALYLRVVLGLSVTATTLLASLTMIANSVSQTFVWGKLSDKYQARTSLIVIGETIAAVGYILIYFLHVYLLGIHETTTAAYSIIFGLSLLEFFWSMSNLGWSALMSDLTTIKERGRLVGAISSIGGVGRIVGISVSAVLYDLGGEAAGFKNGTLFFFAAGIMLASAVLVWFGTRRPEQAFKERSTSRVNIKKNVPSWSHFDSKAFYWFLASIFIVGIGAYSILQIFVLYLDSPIGATSFEIAMIRNSASIATIIFSLLAGPLADRIGRKLALGLGLALATVTPLLYISAQSVSQMIVINSLSGVYRALISTCGYLLAADLIPVELRGRLFGQYNAITYVSFGLAGTFVGGPIADFLIDTGTTEAIAYVTTFQVASIISLIGTLIFTAKVKGTTRTNHKTET